MEVVLLIPIILLIIVVIIYIYSKMGIKKSNEIQITPPDNMNTLELAYIHNKKVSTSDVISLIPYLVDKKYIKMEFPFEPNSKEVCDFKIIKGKEYKGNNALERYILKRLFEERDVITYSELCNNIEYKALFNFCADVVNSDRDYNIIFNKKSKKIKKILNICTMIGLFIFDCIFNIGYIGMCFFQILLLTAISATMNNSDIGVSIGNGPTKLKRNNFKATLVFSAVLLMFSIPFITVHKNNNSAITSGKEAIIYFVGIIIFVFIYLIKTHIEKRNKRGEELYQKIIQFKDFLNITPRESIEAEFNNNKDCYFDIFSFCFVLGMSEKCTSEYDKFFNNVFQILYDVTQNKKTANNLDANTTLIEYNKRIKNEYEKFIQMVSSNDDVFLGKKMLASDIESNCNNGIIKALKKWILES